MLPLAHRLQDGARRGLAAGPVVLVLAAGCGESTDVSGGVAEANKDLAQQGARLQCPKEIDGGSGTEFDCTLRSTRSGKSEKVKLKVTGKDADTVELADQAKFSDALRKVTGGASVR